MRLPILILSLLLCSSIPAQSPATRPGRNPRGGNLGLNSQSLGSAHFEIDADSKTLIVITDEATNEAIGKLIKQIDTPVPHASIKVLFLEVTHSKGSDMGIDVTHHDVEANGDESLLSSIFGVATGITKGGTIAVLENKLDVTIKALAQTNKLEVLSRPSIMARSNEEASITIGEEVPFVRNSQVTDSGTVLNTIEYEDVGIILKVTPVITDDGTVEMKLETEISTMTGETVDVSETVTAPTIAKRSATTKVVVPDGKTVVIGGLMGTQETEAVQKVPILGSIPLIGALFRRTVKEKTKTELLIFLTPNVVTKAEDHDRNLQSEEGRGEMIRETFPNRSYHKYLSQPPAKNADTPKAKVEEEKK